MADKKKVLKLTTPKGLASYVWLKQADTKFKPQGEYTVTLTLTAEDAQPLIDQLEPILAEAMVEQQAAFEVKMAEAKGPQKAKMKAKGEMNQGDFYSPEYDEDGEETGNVVFKFKMNASYIKKSKDGAEEVVKLTPQLFDAKGNKLKVCPNIGAGTGLKVNFSPNSYYTDASHQAGISLRMNAVQVIDLVEFGGGGNAGSYGFDKEDGFEANPTNEDGFKDESTSDSKTSGAPEDF